MQVTFLLGNGFDKSIGLMTGYNDFYTWYLKQPDESEEVTSLKSSIQSYMNKENNNWADFELALGQFTKMFTDRDAFIRCFKSAKASLVQYLTQEYRNKTSADSDFIRSATYRLVELSQSLDKDFDESDKKKFNFSGKEQVIFNCISFNYTPLFRDGKDVLYDNATGISNRDRKYDQYTIGEVLNVHGLIDMEPILGVNDVFQIANTSFREDREIVQLMVKGEADKKAGQGWRAKASNIIQKSDVIYIFGMSLGDTDLFWWERIAAWLEADSKHLLAIYCYPESDKEQTEKKKELFRESILKHCTKCGQEPIIVIDDVAKTMTVKFAYLSVRQNVKTSIQMKLSLEKGKSKSKKSKSNKECNHHASNPHNETAGIRE